MAQVDDFIQEMEGFGVAWPTLSGHNGPIRAAGARSLVISWFLFLILQELRKAK